MGRSIIIFHPDIKTHHTNNEYTKKIYGLIESKYRIESLEWFVRHPFNKNIHSLYLNWYENTVGSERVHVQKIQYILKILILKIAKIRKIKVVYVVHNKTPHNISMTSDIYREAVKPFMNKALNMSDVIVELCKHTEDYLESEYRIKGLHDKTVLVPHGKYTKYKCLTEKYRGKYKIDDNEFVCCFVGKMDKYKNVDIIIKAFYKSGIKAKLLLVGKCDEKYEGEITKLIKDDKVICDFTYVTDKEMSAIMQAVDAIILPYENTSINSGIMINSFSNGTTVIGTDIEMLRDFPDDLSYSYSHDGKNHVHMLTNALKKAYDDYQTGEYRKKGKELEKIVERNNNWDVVATRLFVAIE